MLLFWIETGLPAEISLRFVRKSSLAFEILVGPAVPTEVVVVVIGALLLLLGVTSVLEIVALGEATTFEVGTLFLMKISCKAIAIPTLITTVVVVTLIVATFPVATLVVGEATM